MTIPSYYFIRPNGDTAHNDPSDPDGYVPGELPVFPATYFNYTDYCLEHSIVRIGWPDTGDLRQLPHRVGALSNKYTFESSLPHHQSYLTAFRDIPVGSVILMPDRDALPSGVLYIGQTVRSYEYCPRVPYECAHRIGVQWDRDAQGPRRWIAEALGIDIHGGWWLRAFHQLNHALVQTLHNQIVLTRREEVRSAAGSDLIGKGLGYGK